jgi:cycloeucalenol cycloisomerase
VTTQTVEPTTYKSNFFESDMPRWFSANPDRAWAEKFFLAYIPFWVLVLVLFETIFDTVELGDAPVIGLGLVVAAPMAIVPAVLGRRRGGVPWWDSYWFKAYLYIAIVNFFGNYFISEYFFDVLGMIYHYPNLDVTLDAALVGSGQQRVPVLMYLLTQATYMTYHTTAVVVMRRVLSTRLPVKWLFFMILTLVLSYAWAWTETMSFANAELASHFRYLDREAMLKYGSIIFGLSFIISFPLFYLLDENPKRRWTIFTVIGAAATAAMLAVFLSDIATHIIGTL